jgi:hypothetical protein
MNMKKPKYKPGDTVRLLETWQAPYCHRGGRAVVWPIPPLAARSLTFMRRAFQ